MKLSLSTCRHFNLFSNFESSVTPIYFATSFILLKPLEMFECHVVVCGDKGKKTSFYQQQKQVAWFGRWGSPSPLARIHHSAACVQNRRCRRTLFPFARSRPSRLPRNLCRKRFSRTYQSSLSRSRTLHSKWVFVQPLFFFHNPFCSFAIVFG